MAATSGDRRLGARWSRPCDDLVPSLCGSDVGADARTGVGATALPLDLRVVIAAEVGIAG
ncbi:hypothetical protein [Streptomyces humi]|uniref:hypothetical protein n=1 Tax=Streptomyces humi TaxID=1428620 RepID=UPI00062885D9|nr:hypothetical protein [Streptomyces humi]